MKKAIKKLLLLCILSCITLLSYAQQKTVTGTVTDEEETPLANVSFTVKGTAAGGITDEAGKFSTMVNDSSAVLEFSFVGYVTKEVKIGNNTTLSVTLIKAKDGMDEVVITAFGISSRKKELTYSVPTVSASEITNAGTNNIATALAGKIPGVDFSSTASGPMGGNRINIRGINSLNGSQRPLIVLNGMPINDRDDDGFGGRGLGGNQKGSAINDIDPNDIESVSVLSGANAAAIYGSQGFNGAIIIQTKSGRIQKGLGVDYAFNYTKNKVFDLTDFQTEFGGGTTPDFRNFRKTGNGNDSLPYFSFANSSFGPKFEGQDVIWFDGQIRPWVAQPGNLMDFYNDGSTMNHSLGVSGANDKSSFRLSGTYYKFNGLLPNSELDRKSILFSGNHKISNIISAEGYANYVHASKINPPERIDRANYSLSTSDIASVLKENVVNESGYFLSDSAYANLRGSNLASWILDPLVWSPNKNRWESTRSLFMGNASVTITPIKQLSIRFKGGTQRTYELIESKQPFKSFVAPTNLTQRAGGYKKTQSNSYVNHGDILVTYDGNLNSNLSLNAFAGYSMDDYYDQITGFEDANGLLFNNMYAPINLKPSRITVGGQTTNGPTSNAVTAPYGADRLNALFGSFTLGFKRWLYLNGTFRNDWSSFLPKNRSSFYYPSIGASFIFSDALELPKFINYGKLRVSYGEVGIPGSRYFANNNYTLSESFNGAILARFSNDVPPVDIVAERNFSKELGLDLGLFNDRLKLDFTYYNNKTKNMISRVGIPASTGAANLNVNAGSMQNIGFDIKLSGEIIRSDNFNWEMTWNGTSIKRKVLSLSDNLPIRDLGNVFSAGFIAQVGASPFDIYMSKWKRDATTGKYIIGQDGFLVLDGIKSIVGNSLPKLYGGFVNSISYKEFTLNFLMEYRFGGQIVAYDNQFYTAVGLTKSTLFGRDSDNGGISYYVKDGVNMPISSGTTPPDAVVYNDGIIIDGVTANGQPNTKIVSAYNYYTNRYYAFGTEDAVYDNNYIRLRELSLTYNLPKSIAQKIKAQNLSVSFIGRNLWFLYNTVPNESPDNAYGTSGVNSGVLYSAHPSTRDLGIALRVNF